ncbi:MAG TPA: OsmC family protein [Chitinophagaceae bacterium]|nr:OsmC family protein [Chitinophagaceae bacterium]MCB9054422.1 OsmC family protein [Chitinophagales bacterium]HPG11476.1 OsmC family protein [Chitinophagaceae bacterium]HRX94877.1 OsmC family protein [Chitinophagaceae bacterium]
MTKTITTWVIGQQFSSKLDNNVIQIDGTRENGFGPKALLLSGLAGCSGIDVVDILKKMRVEFSDFSIEVEADQTEEHPRVYKDIHITYKVHTDAANLDKVKKAVDLSLEKYCGVSAMLKKNSDVLYKVEII